MTLGRQTQCGLDSESRYHLFPINVLKEVILICSTETCWSFCNIRPPVFPHRSDIKRQLETGGRGGRGEGGEGVMALRLAIIVSLQVKRVSATPPAIQFSLSLLL